MIELLDIPQRSPQWLKLRQNKVSGTSAYILLTKGLNEALRANNKTFKPNSAMLRGQYLENPAIDIYEKVYQIDILKVGLVLNSKYPNCCFSPDGVQKDVLLLEVKAFNEKRHQSINTVDDIPPQIMAQIQFGLMMLELKKAKLILYNPDIDDINEAYKIINVKENKAIHDNFRIRLDDKISTA